MEDMEAILVFHGGARLASLAGSARERPLAARG